MVAEVSQCSVWQTSKILKHFGDFEHLGRRMAIFYADEIMPLFTYFLPLGAQYSLYVEKTLQFRNIVAFIYAQKTSDKSSQYTLLYNDTENKYKI